MSGEPRVLAVGWVPLGRAVLCLDCEACFEFGVAATCPRCGSCQWTTIESFFTRRQAAPSPCLSPVGRGRVRGIMEGLVPLSEVEHHAGNGLQIALTSAELLRAMLRAPIGPRQFELVDQIRQAILNTMARIRALRDDAGAGGSAIRVPAPDNERGGDHEHATEDQ